MIPIKIPTGCFLELDQSILEFTGEVNVIGQHRQPWKGGREGPCSLRDHDSVLLVQEEQEGVQSPARCVWTECMRGGLLRALGPRWIFSKLVLVQLDSHLEKGKIRHIPYITHQKGLISEI